MQSPCRPFPPISGLSSLRITHQHYTHTTSSLPKPTHLHPLPLSPLTSQHTSLPTFLAHASKTSLFSSSTTYIGTHYEYTTLSALRRLGIDLVRTGGRADKGIDLLGYWYLPGLPTGWPLRVLVQCKALKRKATPNVVRELEGCGTGARGVRWRDGEGSAATHLEEETTGVEAEIKHSENEGVNEEAEKHSLRAEDEGTKTKSRTNRNIIILLATPQEATKGVREAMAQSRWPMAYLKISLHGRVEQLLWNRTAAASGLEGINVVMRHVPKETRQGAAEDDKIKPKDAATAESDQDVAEDIVLKKPNVMDQEIVMTWKNDVWEWPLDSNAPNVQAPPNVQRDVAAKTGQVKTASAELFD